MGLFDSQPGHISLSALTQQLRQHIGGLFAQPVWVSAEIASLNVHHRGHCYLELVELDKVSRRELARMRGVIWATQYNALRPKFEAVTRQPLRAGMEVLLRCNVDFHPVYGLSLHIIDIDPQFTLGQFARQRAETIARLEREGLLQLNGALPFPELPRRVAVISARSAAGYGDFCKHLHGAETRYGIQVDLFEALMQGERASESICQALDKIAEEYEAYDVAIIIRGGGGLLDLSCFDDYTLAKRIAMMPLPVLTGIGHERDVSVADMVAHQAFKTPTAVADYLEGVLDSCAQQLEAQRVKLLDGIARYFEMAHVAWEGHVRLLSHAIEMRLARLQQVLPDATALRRLVAWQTTRQLEHLSPISGQVQRSISQILKRKEIELESYKRMLPMLAPSNFLSKGYAMVLRNGVAIRQAAHLSPGDTVQLAFQDGKATATVESISIDTPEE